MDWSVSSTFSFSKENLSLPFLLILAPSNINMFLLYPYIASIQHHRKRQQPGFVNLSPSLPESLDNFTLPLLPTTYFSIMCVKRILVVFNNIAPILTLLHRKLCIVYANEWVHKMELCKRLIDCNCHLLFEQELCGQDCISSLNRSLLPCPKMEALQFLDLGDPKPIATQSWLGWPTTCSFPSRTTAFNHWDKIWQLHIYDWEQRWWVSSAYWWYPASYHYRWPH